MLCDMKYTATENFASAAVVGGRICAACMPCSRALRSCAPSSICFALNAPDSRLARDSRRRCDSTTSPRLTDATAQHSLQHRQPLVSSSIPSPRPALLWSSPTPPASPPSSSTPVSMPADLVTTSDRLPISEDRRQSSPFHLPRLLHSPRSLSLISAPSCPRTSSMARCSASATHLSCRPCWCCSRLDFNAPPPPHPSPELCQALEACLR